MPDLSARSNPRGVVGARAAVTARAPGRVNLIGEHTDYNDGLALPFALRCGVTVHARRRPGCRIEAQALDLGERDDFAIDAPASTTGWRAFVRGTVAELRLAGLDVPAASVTLGGDVPRGAGLASSAALGVALALAFGELAGGPRLEPLALARLCARVEHGWVGAQTGLLDQLAALHGAPGLALLIDFASLVVEPVPLALDGWTLVVADSGARHVNAASGYNARRAECAAACAALGVRSLRAARRDALASLPDGLARRARHVIDENARVRAAADALRRGAVAELGALLNASHVSLRELYEASTPEVEATVRRLRAAGASGARMVGGGFGGGVLALLAPGVAVPEGASAVSPGAGAAILERR